MAAHLDSLRLAAGSLPQSPGVYFWRDSDGAVLYIGKAVNLRNRVMSYFSRARRDRRTRELLEQSRQITFELTGTELEALFRESALIKQEQPPYNRALRSPRRVSYLKLDGAQPDPYVQVVRQHLPDGSLYFGPFPSHAIARETLAFLHDVLPLRKCTAARPRCRPCLYYQMGKCAAPLLDGEHRRRHQEAIAGLHDLLDGRTDRVETWLIAKRDRLAESLLFEQAAEMQARIEALHDHRRQHAILEAAVACRCVVIRDEGGDDTPRVLLVAHGHVLSVRDLADLTADQLARWVQVHLPIVDAAQYEQPELDAASVLERWLRVKRRSVRWVAIPRDAGYDVLTERAGYIVRPRKRALQPA